VPAVVQGCYGPCVPYSACACQGGWECPQPELYGCYGNERRCHPFPIPMPGADAGP
jgi:hypothetical protein